MDKSTEQLVKQIIKHYGIDVPVMATRVVGKTLELYLYGGRVLRVPIEGEPDLTPDPSPKGEGGKVAKGNGFKKRLKIIKGRVKND